jgi:hypothetical protein
MINMISFVIFISLGIIFKLLISINFLIGINNFIFFIDLFNSLLYFKIRKNFLYINSSFYLYNNSLNEVQDDNYIFKFIIPTSTKKLEVSIYYLLTKKGELILV